jgi:hypothetical protein
LRFGLSASTTTSADEPSPLLENMVGALRNFLTPTRVGFSADNAEHLLRLLLQSLTSARRSAGEQLRVQQLNKMID